MSGKQDPRKYKTREILKSGFINAATKKPIASITIQDVVLSSNIHRSTFYLHYQDMPDFLEQLKRDLLAGLMCKVRAISSLQKSFDSILCQEYYDIYFAFIDKEAPIFRIFLEQVDFRKEFFEEGIQRWMMLLSPIELSIKEQYSLPALLQYIVSAEVGLTEYFLNMENYLTTMASRDASTFAEHILLLNKK